MKTKIELRLLIVLFTVCTLYAAPALACSDLPNICGMQAAHHQQMIDIAATPPQSYDGGGGGGSSGGGYHYLSRDYSQVDTSAATIGRDNPNDVVANVAQNYAAILEDPRYKEYINGIWFYPGSSLPERPKDFPCAALFMRKGEGVLLLSPTPGEKMASMIFLGPDIPRPRSGEKVEVTLTQSDGSAQTTNAMNMPFQEEFGALLFAVPTMDLLVDNMQDKESFAITMQGKTVADLEWVDGLTAKSTLTQCLKK